MLQNAYLDGKIGVDTAENEPRKAWCVVADRPWRYTPDRPTYPDLGRGGPSPCIRCGPTVSAQEVTARFARAAGTSPVVQVALQQFHFI